VLLGIICFLICFNQAVVGLLEMFRLAAPQPCLLHYSCTPAVAAVAAVKRQQLPLMSTEEMEHPQEQVRQPQDSIQQSPEERLETELQVFKQPLAPQ
jgi:hypothetical protein